MLNSIRTSRLSKIFSGFLSLTFITTNLAPLPMFALTSGPSQPETQQFAPAGMDNMVDPFTGDFSYNIPLLDVGGYPVNLNYAAGSTPDQEASWVGLGWNLNVGAINRSVRGLPDDFAGDEVVKQYHTKPNQTVGVNGYIQPEVWGIDALDLFKVRLNASLFYNNYNGFGMTVGMNPSLSASLGSKSHYNANLGLNLSVGSEDGVGITPSIGIGPKKQYAESENTLGGKLSFPFSSKEGLKGMSLSASYQNGTTTGAGADKSYKADTKSSGNAFLGFAVPAYTPFSESNTYSINASGDIALSFVDNSFFEGDVGGSLYYNGQFLEETTRNTNAFGYLHSGLASTYPLDKRLMDFNREKDGGGFNKFTLAMPLANHTYDIFSVSGQGVGGTYRAYRGDIGTISDISAKDRSYSPEGGVELSFGTLPQPTVKVGVHFKCNVSNGYTGDWQNGGNPVPYALENPANSLYEPVYFKKIGEMAAESDKDYFDKVLFGYNMVNNEVIDNAGGWLTNKLWLDNVKANSKAITARHRTQRDRMNTKFTALTASEVKRPISNYSGFANQKTLDNTSTGTARAELKIEYPLATPKSTEGQLQRVSPDGIRKGHHLSEIRVTDNSGARYVYGVPVYNNFQEEVTFALNHKNKTKSELDNYRKSGLAPYDTKDAGVDNKNGIDHFFSKTRTPSNASSFLLTEILSSDYVDSDNTYGPSDGDLGNYTKFNYSRTSSNYRWRTPFQGGMVSFNDGKYGTTNDDKGNYVYGEKEVWYLHSIETRTHVAEFYLADRKDGLGVAGSSGGISNDKDKRLQYLDKIVLYSKQDKLNGKSEPLKVVHFEYDYSLCPNTPNSIADGKGKLTLKKVWFTYGYSGKGALNPYKFIYADKNFDKIIDAELNPSYNIKNYDKWGNYKSEDDNILGNEVFPYVNQNKTDADKNAAMYALSSIQTPTGGTMRVYYESDDYAYVQNKQAMEMFHVHGIVGDASVNVDGYNSDASLGGKKLYSLLNAKTLDLLSNNNLIVKLNQPFVPKDGSNAAAEFREKYINGLGLMYFKMKVKVLNAANRYEYVPGYALIEEGNCAPLKNDEGIYTYGLIKLKPVKAAPSGALNQTVNSITRNSLAYLKLYMNRESFGSANAEDNGIEQVAGSMLSMTKQIAAFIGGFTNLMLAEGNCTEIETGPSYVRLKSPNKMKLGGGHRVKAIVMQDNWEQMASDMEKKEPSTLKKESSYYGQYYDYTFKENTGKFDGEGKPIYETISAGVAAYEPQLGGDENPFRQPLFVTETALLAPSKEYYLEEPFGESFFPGPSIGYKKIRTIPMKATEADLISRNFKGNGTGYVEQEFYTSQEFPTIVKRTDINTSRYKTPINVDFLVSLSEEMVTNTQGYYIETNDMHGKEKSKKVMPDPKLVEGKLVDSEPISYVEYQYRKDEKGQLSNKVPYVNSDLNVDQAGAEMGVEIDITTDQKFSKHSTKGGGADVNPKGTAPSLPLPIVLFGLTIIPSWVDNYSEFKYIVTTKVVSRHAILEKTIAKDNGQTITTHNLAWDKETGQVLLTKVQNEFHDDIWNFTYPGHWAYPEMGLAYQNEGLIIDNMSKLSATPDANLHLQDGDEFIIKKGLDIKYGYVNKGTNNNYSYIDQTGGSAETNGAEYIKIIRSGHRNVAETPVGSIACLDNPMTTNGAALDFSNVRVLNAGATQFKHVWKKFCNCSDALTSTNPFVLGQKAVIRPWRSWTYLTNRVLTKENNNPNIRKDGYFADFNKFWNYNTSSKLLDTLEIVNRDVTKWQYVTEIENYNPVGMEIENKDALGRFSMAQFGYGRNLPVGTSNNSKYQESGYDGFEDYKYGDCKDDHFSWRNETGSVTDEEAHTGRQSIKVLPGKKLVMRKVINPCKNNTSGTNAN